MSSFQVQQLLLANDIQADISLADFIFKYKNNEKMYQRIVRQYKSLLEFGKEEKKEEEKKEEKKSGFVLTGIEGVDLQILSNLDDNDLLSLCMIDKRLNKYCEDNSTLWKNRIKNVIGNIPNGRYISLEEKPEKYTWKQWYFYIRSVPKKYKRASYIVSTEWHEKNARYRKQKLAPELCNLIVNLADWAEASKSEKYMKAAKEKLEDFKGEGVEACGDAISLLS